VCSLVAPEQGLRRSPFLYFRCGRRRAEGARHYRFAPLRLGKCLAPGRRGHQVRPGLIGSLGEEASGLSNTGRAWSILRSGEVRNPTTDQQGGTENAGRNPAGSTARWRAEGDQTALA
jgi:hypothetical protein